MKTKIKILLVMMICLSVVVCGVSASETHHEGHIDIIFDQNTCFTEEQQQIITAMLLGDESNSAVNTFGVKCILFGHTYTSDLVSLVHHRVRTSNPRCEELIYKVEICEECSDTQYTLLSSTYIECCP